MSISIEHVRDLSMVDRCDLAADLTRRGHADLASWVIAPPGQKPGRCFNAFLRDVEQQLSAHHPGVQLSDLSMASAFYFYSQGETAAQFVAKLGAPVVHEETARG